MSLAAIRRLNRDSIKCCVLTQGILPIELKELYGDNEYGITLISLDEKYREKMEREPLLAKIGLRHWKHFMMRDVRRGLV
jgi:hypothetical protein